MRYRPEIDGLRAVAVLPVIAFHAMPEMVTGGFLGVDVFFVISGYLITGLLAADLQAGRFSLLRFYERRARRILPALIAVLLATLPFAWGWMLPGQLEEHGRALIAVAGFYSNIHYWMQDGYFARASELKPLLHSWSLAVEEQYYLFFPLALAFFWRRWPALVRPLLALGLLLSLALAHLLAGQHPRAAFFLLPSRAWELLAGALAALWLMRAPHPRQNGPAAALGLGMILAAFALIDRHDRIPGLPALLPVLGTVLVILFAGPRTWAGRLLSRPLPVGLGLISYSAYLWHQPVFAFARMRAFAPIPAAGYLALAALSLALAWLSWRFVERPFRKGAAGAARGQGRGRGRGPGGLRLSRGQVFGLSGLASAAILLIGLVLSRPLVEPARFARLRPVSESFLAMIEARAPWGRGNQCEVWPLSQWRRQWHGCDPYAPGAQEAALPGARQGAGPQHAGQTGQGDGAQGDAGQGDAGQGDAGALLPIPIAVMGDSHATDLAAGLRLNGFEPFQATGAGCSIVPRNMSANCRAFFDHAIAAIRERPQLRWLWLAHRFRPSELRPEVLNETFRYWSGAGLEIVFFAPRPEYPGRNDLILKAEMFGRPARLKADRTLSDLSRHPDLLSAARAFDVTLIDSEEEYCEFTGSCGYRLPGGPYLTSDHSHFTNFGARFFVGHVLREYMCALGPEIRRRLPADTDTPGAHPDGAANSGACRS